MMDTTSRQYTKTRIPPWPALLGMALVAVVTLSGLATLVYGNVRAFAERGLWVAGPSTHTSGPGAAAVTQISHEPQVRDAGNVKVVVQWQGLAGVEPGDPAVAAPEGVFNISLDTHSVDLDEYSLDQVAVLHAASGEEVRPTTWVLPKGGHHRSGNVVFPGRDSLGNPLFAAPAGEIELVIHDIAGVEERTFLWPLSR